LAKPSCGCWALLVQHEKIEKTKKDHLLGGLSDHSFIDLLTWKCALLMVHAHLMLSQFEMKNLGGTLSDTQC
jgi:hypothetical protein